MWRYLVLLMLPQTASADMVVAARNLPAQRLLSMQDLRVIKDTAEGAFSTAEQVAGLETRIAIYAGHEITPQATSAPAVVARNAPVKLLFIKGGLSIMAEGRSLGRAAVGETVRVMNLSSKTTVWGIVTADGSVHVGSTP